MYDGNTDDGTFIVAILWGMGYVVSRHRSLPFLCSFSTSPLQQAGFVMDSSTANNAVDTVTTTVIRLQVRMESEHQKADISAMPEACLTRTYESMVVGHLLSPQQT